MQQQVLLLLQNVLVTLGMILGGLFLNGYLNNQVILYGMMVGSVVLFLLGSILSVTAIILFSMVNLIRNNK